MLEAALAAGIASGGGDALLGGVLPTPAASILVRRLGFDLAAVVSASHNPYRDNGIKFFAAPGTKLDDEAEAAIEARLDDAGGAARRPGPRARGRPRRLPARAAHGLPARPLAAARSSLDCANGATYRAAPAIFERLGAEVEAIADRARRAQHQRRLRLDPSRGASPSGSPPPTPRSASPSTATATA